jgi:hypothetical protein
MAQHVLERVALALVKRRIVAVKTLPNGLGGSEAP